MKLRFPVARLVLAILIVLSLCSFTPKKLRVGIAWRADFSSEFMGNVAEALKILGVEPVFLDQVRPDDFEYEDKVLKSWYLDSNDVLRQKYADVIKEDTWHGTNAHKIISGVDAVIFTGGEDVAPTLFRKPQPWHGIPEEKDFNATRDISDYLTMAYCLDKNIPVLGICRGMQVLAIVSGAGFIQDIPTYYAQQGKEYDNTHRNILQPGKKYRDYAPQSIDVIDKDSFIYSVVQADRANGLPSWHHQAVGSLDGTDLKLTAATTSNGITIPEAIEREDKDLAVGIQFHPEAAIGKHLKKARNAGDYMTYEEAIRYFEVFIDKVGKLAYAGVKTGPWICETRENSLTILWTSEKPGMAYVELADGTRHYETFAGRRIFRRLHSIHLQGFRPGEVVRYRIGGQNLKDDYNARNPIFGYSYEGPWQAVRTFNHKAKTCRFSIFNDIHMRVKEYRKLAAQVDSAATDFLFLNGDITSAGNYVLDTAVSYAIKPLGSLTAGLPLHFARGNHEGRGNNVQLFAEIYPNSTPAPFYYTFRQGPVAFIVFDAGETGESRSILYSGGKVYEDYLAEQLAWAKEAVKEESFRKAPVKICLLHVPMIDHPDKDDYLLQRWLNVHFMSLLNKAGINLMIGADLHEFMYCEPGTMNNNFPIVVNDDARRMDVSYADGTISLTMTNADGKVEFKKSLPVK